LEYILYSIDFVWETFKKSPSAIEWGIGLRAFPIPLWMTLSAPERFQMKSDQIFPKGIGKKGDQLVIQISQSGNFQKVTNWSSEIFPPIFP
jgi:hypothetical protein